MTGSDTPSLIYALMLLVFIASGLAARRLPMAQTLKYALSWIAIFGIGFVLFSFRGEAGRVWQRVSAEFRPNDPDVSNGTVRIRRGEDGHFHVNADVNGHKTLFLVDSGATTTALSAASAKAASVVVDENDFPVIVDTANGSTKAMRARIQRLSIGPVTRIDLPVLVAESFGDTNLLGMNFLDSLNGWRVEGDMMVLNP
jgi:aspartyl protease family protein